jgi:diguanylate cyclase (GGDEF)-like protein
VSEGAELILIADDDEDIVRFVEVNLRLEGFRVATAADGRQALERAEEMRPDLILLDIMMPEIDGFEVCRRIRKDARTRHIPVVMLTAKSLSADKVVGLTAGADDYIIKPFDPVELVARVKSTLRRGKELRALNPLTGLPGNVDAQEEIARRIDEGTPFALLHVDLDNFKAFNDHYGFVRGDDAIRLLAACVTDAVQRHDVRGAFIGHIGGDDFIAVLDPVVAESTAKDIVAAWDRGIGELYDDDDRTRGYIEVADRRNQYRRFPIATVSIGISTSSHRPLNSHWEAAEIATEMKRFAKRERGSAYAMDRRRPQGGS